MKQRVPNFVIARQASGQEKREGRNLGGATPVGKKLLSRYFSPEVRPIIATRAIPDVARLCILWTIMRESRAGARATAEENLVDPDSTNLMAEWMVREFMRAASGSESREARVLLRGAIGIAREFGLEDLRKHAAVRLCNRLLREFESIEAAKLAAEELPPELRRALIGRWLNIPSKSAPILAELRKERGY
ncbi:hypothetical protein JW721_01610 [Candidatus Micrarchaeota archaeon]|nr:hypothetical protein [Candidatus Micrarchaeota archaeon]